MLTFCAQKISPKDTDPLDFIQGILDNKILRIDLGIWSLWPGSIWEISGGRKEKYYFKNTPISEGGKLVKVIL